MPARSEPRRRTRCRRNAKEVGSDLAGGPATRRDPIWASFPPHLKLRPIGQQGCFALGLQLHIGRSASESGRPALAGAADRVARGRIQIRELDSTVEPGIDRTDPGTNHGEELAFRLPLDALATGNALLEHARVVERLPYAFPGRRDAEFTVDVHCRNIPEHPPATVCTKTRAGELRPRSVTPPPHAPPPQRQDNRHPRARELERGGDTGSLRRRGGRVPPELQSRHPRGASRTTGNHPPPGEADRPSGRRPARPPGPEAAHRPASNREARAFGKEAPFVSTSTRPPATSGGRRSPTGKCLRRCGPGWNCFSTTDASVSWSRPRGQPLPKRW